MEAPHVGHGNILDVTGPNPPGIPTRSPIKASGSAKRQPKESSKLKSPPTHTAGTRFQCPRCPKNFSRIENLTRHQANHEDVGKFACVICRKRFTRSDLLNRHRRIHGPQAESTKSHVTRSECPSNAGSSPSLSDVQCRRSASQDPSSSFSTQSPQSGYHPSDQHHQVHHAAQNMHDGYQPSLHQPEPIPQGNLPSTQVNIMEAGLPPANYAFPPLENANPSLWDGFMTFGDTPTTYMGTYDADMSWALDYLPSENSPNYLLDHDMLNSFEDFEDYPYQEPKYEQAPPPPLPLPPSQDTEDADGEDDDATDWPDKLERPDIPERMPNRIVPVRVHTISWQSVVHEARSSGLSPATIRPMETFSEPLRDTLLATLNGSNFRNEISRPEISEAMFPPSEVLDFFLRLYIRYIHPRFPVLHLPTFDIYNSSPLLLVSMMFLGSSHSNFDRGRFSRLFHEHLRIAIMRIQEVDKKYLRNVDNILTFFLLCLAGTWSGSKNSYEFAEGSRGILITACRRSRLLDCRSSARIEPKVYQLNGHGPLESTWLAWIETEKRKRLGLSIYLFDCQYPALFNNQPYVSKAETTNCVFPCDEEYWIAPSATTWSILVGPSNEPSCTYYLHALNCCLLPKWVKTAPPAAKTNEFGKIILIYALHTHIFEWRQATSMLNPTGLMGTFGNSAAHDMGEGLRERRRWLVGGLDSFYESYSNLRISPHTSVASQLLRHLGYISLDVSLSDMHLVAGRSANSLDSTFASENLKQWANSPLSSSTMQHISSMLALCHSSIESGVAADASYEISIGLFTGGIVCWAFAKLRNGVQGTKERDVYVEQVRKASMALREMGCWRMCSMFGRILEAFEAGGKSKEAIR